MSTVNDKKEPLMSYRDLWEWLKQVENLGELRRVEGAD
jgi:hypothetical protein